MSFKAVPVEMILAPNYFSVLPDNRWDVEGENAVDLWFQLNSVDALGERRYIVASGDVLTVIFQRADLIESQGARRLLNNTERTIEKTATPHADDASLFRILLTSADVGNIVSGSLKFKLEETSKTSEWVMNWAIVKKQVDPGF